MHKSINKVTVLYFLFGVVWIKFSDRIILSFLKDPVLLTKFQTYKGIFFVLMNTVLIYFLLKNEIRKIEKLDGEKDKFNQLIRAIVANTNSYVAVKDLEGKYHLTNEAALKFYGKTEKEMIGKKVREIFPKGVAEELIQQDKEVLKKRVPVEFEGEMIDPQGGAMFYHSSKFPLKDDDGNIYSIGVISSDVTEKKRYYERLKIEAKIFENLKQGIILTDRYMTIVENNKSVCKILDCESEKLVGKKLEELIVSNDKFKKILCRLEDGEDNLEYELFLKKNGNYFPARFSISTIKNSKNELENYIILMEDLTEIKEMNKRIMDLEHTDSLTGLKNHYAFVKYLEEVINYSEKYRGKFAIIYVGINDLKFINRSFGHKAGYELIQKIGKKLFNFTNDKLNIGKITDDEFAVVVLEKIKIFELRILAQEILDSFKESIKIIDKDIYVGLNMGISIYPNDGENIDILIKNANIALQSSKKRGKNSIEFYSSRFNEELDTKFELLLAKNYKK